MTLLEEKINRGGPISPHLQVYNMFALTSFLSILHRIFGAALFVGTLLFVYWIGSAASGPKAYDAAMNFLGSWFGYLLIFGWSFALFYHMCNGVRHMTWDTSRMIDLKSIYQSGYVMVGCAFGLTLIAWVVGLSV
ncbi:MAG: succinate dehydrogenase, cytochrome b556 subunit [Rhodospirillaceae bacterium]|nr:succinate dehydrogenase, cytochrome b556 subunit [Rhodospirillaceae bacterium]